MKDGLYRVVTAHFVAGFTVLDNKVDRCAPILARRIHYWKTIAIRIAP